MTTHLWRRAVAALFVASLCAAPAAYGGSGPVAEPDPLSVSIPDPLSPQSVDEPDEQVEIPVEQVVDTEWMPQYPDHPEPVPQPEYDQPNPEPLLETAQLPALPVLPPDSGLPPIQQRNAGAATTGYTSFAGIGNTGSTPPDTSAAAGPNHVVEAVNSSWAIYGRGGGAPGYKTTLKSWFSATRVFDPHVMYEPHGGRFVLVASDGTNWVIAISQNTSSSAYGTWCIYKPVAANAGQLADFPLVGGDSRYVYLTMNNFDDLGDTDGDGDTEYSFSHSRLLALNRTHLESCQSASGWLWSNVKDPGPNTAAFSIAPAINYDTADSNGYLVNSYSGGASSVSLRYVGSDNKLYSKKVTVPSYSSPKANAPQKGSTGLLDAGDSRIFQAVHWKSGLYAALTSHYEWTKGTPNTVVRWMKFDPKPGQQKLTVAGGFGYQDHWFFYPSMSQNTNGVAMFNFALSSTTRYPGVAYVSMDTANTLGSALYLSYGTNAYAPGGCTPDPCRWGDYSSAFVDPADTTRFWIAGETTTAANTWGTRIGQVGP